MTTVPLASGSLTPSHVLTAMGLGSTAAFFVVARYRIPWTPGLTLLGGAGLVDLCRRIRGRADTRNHLGIDIAGAAVDAG